MTDPDVEFCLKRVGKSAVGWDTLVVHGSADAAQSAEALWSVWTDVAHWPAWSPLHVSVTRPETGELTVGSAFDQRMRLGFPVGTTTERVTLAVLEPARRAAWEGAANGVRNCHLWSFTPLPDGGARVRNTEVFVGWPAALLRPLAARRWNRDFQGAVDGLIRRAGNDRVGGG